MQEGNAGLGPPRSWSILPALRRSDSAVPAGPTQMCEEGAGPDPDTSQPGSLVSTSFCCLEAPPCRFPRVPGELLPGLLLRLDSELRSHSGLEGWVPGVCLGCGKGRGERLCRTGVCCRARCICCSPVIKILTRHNFASPTPTGAK